MSQQKYSLNLSPKYAPNWSVWEIAREFICNAIDAAPNEFTLETPNSNTLKVWTPTAPGVAEMFMIGEGSKSIGGAEIGQFGEGSKLAALACTRIPGASLRIHAKDVVVTFGFEEMLGAQCLHAYVDQSDAIDGMMVEVSAPGVATAIAGRIFPNAEDGPMCESAQKMALFVKGIFIASDIADSIWNWNLSRVTINRDRSMPDSSSVRWQIVYWLAEHGTDEQFDRIVAHGSPVIETDYMQHTARSGLLEKLTAAARRKWGQKICLSCEDHKANANAKAKGYTLVSTYENLAYALLAAGVPTSTSIPQDRITPKAVDSARYKPQIERLRQVSDIVNIEAPTVCVFSIQDVAILGLAERLDGRLWLSESLFAKGNEFELVRTYLHELAHFISEAADETRSFENALDWLTASFAMMAIGDKVSA